MTNRTDRREIPESYVTTMHDFGLKDEKGRNVGTCELIFTSEYVELTDAEKAARPWFCGYDKPAGRKYGFKLHATRNGRGYGASHGYHEFDTADEREAALKAAIENSRKTYTRKYGAR